MHRIFGIFRAVLDDAFLKIQFIFNHHIYDLIFVAKMRIDRLFRHAKVFGKVVHGHTLESMLTKKIV